MLYNCNLRQKSHTSIVLFIMERYEPSTSGFRNKRSTNEPPYSIKNGQKLIWFIFSWKCRLIMIVQGKKKILLLASHWLIWGTDIYIEGQCVGRGEATVRNSNRFVLKHNGQDQKHWRYLPIDLNFGEWWSFGKGVIVLTFNSSNSSSNSSRYRMPHFFVCEC